MINEDAPTNSTGAPIAGIGVGPDGEPGVTRLTRKRPKKRRKYEMSTAQMLQTEQTDNYLPFRVAYLDGQVDFILYGKSEAQVKIELRKIYRPEMAKKFTVTRLYPNQVIKFYWDKRQQALRNQ